MSDPAGHRGQPARLLIPTSRADVRVTWHDDGDTCVVSLWHGDTCVASGPLTIRDAVHLATFLVEHLGARAEAAALYEAADVTQELRLP